MSREKVIKRIEQLEAQLAKKKAELEEMGKVYKPVGGSWFIDGYGEPMLTTTRDKSRLACLEYTTKEEAQRAIEEDHTRNVIRNYRDYLLRKGVGKGQAFNNVVVYSWTQNMWMFVSTCINAQQGTYLRMPEAVAKEVAAALNDGYLILTLPEHMLEEQ